LYLPRVIVRMENLVEWMAGETEVLGENLPRRTLSTTNPTWPDPGLNPGRRHGIHVITKRLRLVSIATSLQAARLGFICCPWLPDLLWGPSNPVCNGYRRVVFPEVKQQGHESDHSLPSSAEVKNGGAESSVCRHGIMFKYRENFTYLHLKWIYVIWTFMR
jgi:hypothetical protein